jgi:hypothetical protein
MVGRCKLPDNRSGCLLDPVVELARLVKGCKGDRVAVYGFVADYRRERHTAWSIDAGCCQPKGELLVVALGSIAICLLCLWIRRVDEC